MRSLALKSPATLDSRHLEESGFDLQELCLLLTHKDQGCSPCLLVPLGQCFSVTYATWPETGQKKGAGVNCWWLQVLLEPRPTSSTPPIT